MKNFGFLGKKSVVVILICILLISGLGYIYHIGILRVEVPKPKKDMVGIIRVEGSILFSETANHYGKIINNAMVNESVKAVVLYVDSPGGYANLIEQIYLDLLELKKKKPLVAFTTSALSGGYYITVAADYIYVCPTSAVGNVGVIGINPPTLIPSEIVLETGAYKVTGFSQLLFPYNLSRVLDGFVSAVEAGRGDRLKLSSTQLKKGMVYFGREALTVGLADEIGSLQKAVRKAAEEAGLIEYDVVDLTGVGKVNITSSSGYNQIRWENLTIEVLKRLYPPPTIYYLYLPQRVFAQSSFTPAYMVKESNLSVSAEKEKLVLIDNTHGNKVSWWEFDILIQELVKRNMTVRFVSEWKKLNSTLNNASCLIIASPINDYSMEEVERIKDFVNNGGMLLLFFDPAAEYVEKQVLFGPINSISTSFGISFAKGYLYNENEHYGLYRNIYVKKFADNNLTQNLTSLIFFTATHLYSMGKGIAWTSNDTYSSTAEKAGNYIVIAYVKMGNGTVVAFGDLTFLREPYCYLEDNYKLIENIASAITKVEVKVKVPPEKVEEKAR